MVETLVYLCRQFELIDLAYYMLPHPARSMVREQEGTVKPNHVRPGQENLVFEWRWSLIEVKMYHDTATFGTGPNLVFSEYTGGHKGMQDCR
jgi:hypothetical protein